MRILALFLRLLPVTAIAPLRRDNGDSSAGVYSGSKTPSSLPWNTYNYCNAPHVNSRHYDVPHNSKGAELVYVNAIIRHHKRTPDNLYPTENELNPAQGWDCSNFLTSTYGALSGRNSESAHILHDTVIPDSHPFLSQIWNGSCEVGQLTAEGLQDSVAHGKDFASVYKEKLKFLKDVNDIYVRTTNEDRTYQVAAGLLYGIEPSIAGKPFKVHNQPANIESLVPAYSCPNADAIRSQYQSVPAWTDHINENAPLKARLDATLGTAGLEAWSFWYDHFFDTFTSRTCHGHSLPCNSSGACVSQDDANLVHEIGNLEYNYIWKAAQNASNYNSLTFGVMFKELAQNFDSFKAGHEAFKLRFYVGHDGSMIRLASGLGIKGPLKWPALGSEFVFEVWKTLDHSLFVRLMFEGTPAEGLEWVPMDQFIKLLESNVPDNLFERCLSS